MTTFFSGVWTSISTAANTAWTAFTEWISGVWNGISTTASTVWNGCDHLLLGRMDKHFHRREYGVDEFQHLDQRVSGTASPPQPVLYSTESKRLFPVYGLPSRPARETVWNSFTTWIGGVWDGISGKATSVWNGVTSFFATTWNNIKSGATTGWNNIKSGIESTWNTLRTNASTSWRNITNAVSTAITNAKTGIVQGWTNIKNGVKGVWDSVLGVIKSPIESAKDLAAGEGQLLQGSVQTSSGNCPPSSCPRST